MSQQPIYTRENISQKLKEIRDAVDKLIRHDTCAKCGEFLPYETEVCGDCGFDNNGPVYLENLDKVVEQIKDRLSI